VLALAATALLLLPSVSLAQRGAAAALVSARVASPTAEAAVGSSVRRYGYSPYGYGYGNGYSPNGYGYGNAYSLMAGTAGMATATMAGEAGIAAGLAITTS